MEDTSANRQFILKDWFLSKEGFLNEHLELAYDKHSGQHFRATSDISASENDVQVLCRCPFSLSLSFLNVLSAPPANIRNCSSESVCTSLLDRVPRAVVSYFFLCEQRLLAEKSFWYPYLAALPREEDMTTPWWFDEQDLKWLLGTNIHLSAEAERSGIEMRRSMWKEQWKEGVQVLKNSGSDVEKFTWELFLWAATVFSSRSFTSQIFTTSTAEASGKAPFALLYPVLDSFNHKFGTKVLWNMDHGDFELSTTEPTTAGKEVFNNYAPKGNEELLNGYGFCIEDNSCDEVSLKIGKPPEPVLTLLREKYPERYASDEWTDEAALFFLRGSNHYSGGYARQMNDTDHLRGISPELEGTIRIILDYSYRQQGTEMRDEWLDPAAADAILERLIAKYNGIRVCDEHLPTQPANEKQKFAKIYRDGQLSILEEIIGELQAYVDEF